MVLFEDDPPSLLDEDEITDELGADATRLHVAPTASRRVLSPYLIVAAGSYSVGTIARAEKGTIIGRAADADLMLLEKGVSRKHARVVLDPDGTVWLEDMGSRNGLVVDGRKVSQCRIGVADLVEIGDAALSLVFLQAGERLSAGLRPTTSGANEERLLQPADFIELINVAASGAPDRDIKVALVRPARGAVSLFVMRRLAQLALIAAKDTVVVSRLHPSVLGLFFLRGEATDIGGALELLQDAAMQEEVFEDGPRPALLTRLLVFRGDAAVAHDLSEAVAQLAG